MINGFCADEKLIQTAKNVTFRWISAKSSLKCAHSDSRRSSVAAFPFIMMILATSWGALLASVVSVVILKLLLTLGHHVVSRLESIREIRSPPYRLILLRPWGLGHIFLPTVYLLHRIACRWWTVLLLIWIQIIAMALKALIETDVVLRNDWNALVLNDRVFLLFLDLCLAPCHRLIVDNHVVNHGVGPGRFSI